MRVLVTGAAGFVGRYLVEALEQAGHTPLLQDLAFQDKPDHPHWCYDLRDTDAIITSVREARPDACIHLGALSFVPDGDKDPGAMLDINVAGTTRLLQACRDHAPEARLLVVSTAQVYGTHPDPEPIRENDPLRPTSMYGISKAAADVAALGYADAYGLDVMTARPGNHTGPGQPPRFAVPAFASKVKAVAEGNDSSIQVGNLESTRDISDVRDVVRAYLLLLKTGRAGNAYNISSGRHLKMSAIVDALCSAAGVHPRREVSPALYRPTDAAPHLDTSRLQAHTGWTPSITVDDTLRDIYATAFPASSTFVA